jgi:tetratricopeptide (TPR) repeat protein
MRLNWTNRTPLLLPAVALLGIAVYPALAQKGVPPASGTSGGASGGGVFGTTGRPTGAGSLSGSPGGIGGLSRPIFLSGRVVLDDGTQPNANIRIERVCAGNAHLETHTDSKGRFSLQLGQEQSVDTDAADASPTTRSAQTMGASNTSMSGNGRLDQLWNCELRAALPGYRSDVVELGSRRSLDDPDLGTIVLHRLTNVQGTTISVTTALAPKHAQKDYEKGLQLAQKGDFENAEKRLTVATQAYPKYAIAWFALGQVEQHQGKNEEARKAWQAAAAADSKYLSPYEALAALAVQEQKWQEAADYSKQVIDMNPVEFPAAFWYNGLANYRLKKPDAAEKSIRDLLKLDTAHKYPQAESLLAQILAEKGNYSEAATHLRAYLAIEPNAKNADALRQALEKMDQASAEPKKQ